MTDGFAVDWLAARDPYDVAALDRVGLDLLRPWLAEQPSYRPLRVVDLGCGTGSGLRRTLTWLDARPVVAYAVDRDAALLAALVAGDLGSTARGASDSADTDARVTVVPVLADVLGPLDGAGGPADGTVDLLVSHAVADLFPLDRFASRIRALLRPGGRAQIALTYDGETRFAPDDAADLERRTIAAYHRHMDRARAQDPTYGGSTAGRRLVAALEAAGLEIVRAAPSTWDVRAGDGPGGVAVLTGLIDYVIRAVAELGDPPADEVARWERSRRAALDAGALRASVRHLDVIAGRGMAGVS